MIKNEIFAYDITKAAFMYFIISTYEIHETYINIIHIAYVDIIDIPSIQIWLDICSVCKCIFTCTHILLMK